MRSSYRYQPQPDPSHERLRARIIALATAYGRYGYRTITGFLRREGWDVGKDRVYTIWRQEGLKVPAKQPKRARLWRVDGSCVRLRPTHRHHVWSYDFVAERTHDGRAFRILNVLDEYTRECLASVVARRIRSQDVILLLTELFIHHGVPQHIRSDNGPEFVTGLAEDAPGRAAVYRARVALGKRRYRIIQWEDAGSVPRWRVVLHAQGSADSDGTLADPLQHGPSA